MKRLGGLYLAICLALVACQTNLVDTKSTSPQEQEIVEDKQREQSQQQPECAVLSGFEGVDKKVCRQGIADQIVSDFAKDDNSDAAMGNYCV